MDSKARAAINRVNAKKSTGPKSEAGKNASKYNALKHGLNSHRPLDFAGLSDTEAIAAVRAAYEDEYCPQTLAETEAVHALIETSWQLSRVRRLLDLAFLQGGDLLTTSKMIDNYSRHQYRLHRMYKDQTARLEDLLAQRDLDQNDPGFVSQQNKPNGLPANGFVLQNPKRPIPISDRSPDRPRPDESGFVSQTNQANDLPETGFVSQNRSEP